MKTKIIVEGLEALYEYFTAKGEEKKKAFRRIGVTLAAIVTLSWGTIEGCQHEPPPQDKAPITKQQKKE